MNITAIGSTLKKAIFSTYRVFRTDDEGRLEIATERDLAPIIWANEINSLVGTSYYPNPNGIELENKNHLTLQLFLTNCTTIIEASLDRIRWIPICLSCLNMSIGGYSAEYNTGVGLSDDFLIDLERINVMYIRCAVTYFGAVNRTSIIALTRKS